MVAPFPVAPPSGKSFKTVRRPNLGVYLDREPLDMDPRALADCRNVRIKEGAVRNQNMGWERFPPASQFPAGAQVNLDGERCIFIDQFFSRQGAQSLIFGSAKDLFFYSEGTGTVVYLTPIYSTGTASITNGTKAVTGAGGTLWDTARTTYPTAGGFGKNAVSGMQISFTTNAQNDPAAVWYEIDAVASDTALTILTNFAETTRTNEAYTIRQTFTGTNFDRWRSEIFPDAQDPAHAPAIDKDLYYLTNGVEMLFWDGIAAQPEWFFPGFVARGFLYYKQALMAFYITEGGETKPQAIKATDLTNPNDWTTGNATEFVAADGVSDLLNMLALGDQVVTYYNRDIALVQFVGPPINYISRVAMPGVGLAASDAIMDFGDFHEFLSADSAYRFDGVSLEEIGPQVFRDALRRVAPDRIDLALTHIDEENGEVLWVLPLTTDGQLSDQSPTTAFVEHYLEDIGSAPVPMTIRDLPATATGFFERAASLRFSDLDDPHAWSTINFKWDDRAFQAAFPFNLFGDDDGNIWVFGTSDAHGSSPFLNSFARFPRFAIADGRRKGLIQRVEPHTMTRGGSSGYKLNVALHLSDKPSGEIEKIALSTFDMTHTGLRHVPFRDSGRYCELVIGTSLANQPWDCAGYGVQGVPVGER